MQKLQCTQMSGCIFAYTKIPLEKNIHFAITPMDDFGNRGKTIYSKVAKFAKSAEPPKPAEHVKPAEAAKPAEKGK